MKLIPRTQITIAPRQRSELSQSSVNDLANSISELGLINPLLVHWEGIDSYRLVAGRTRLAALDLLGERGTMFTHGGELLSPSEIPVVDVNNLSAADIHELEFVENELRSPLSWQDRITAIAELKRLREAEADEEPVTNSSVARELVDKSPETAHKVDTIRKIVAKATVVSKHLSDPAVAKARSEHEAYDIIMKREHEAAQAELIRRRQKRAAKESHQQVLLGSALDLLPDLEPHQFDLILTDPPYGIGADSVSSTSKMSVGGHRHLYEDTEENAQALYRSILREGFRICKPKANCFIFTEIRHWPFLQQISAQMGWTPWPHPVIWQKSEAEGLAPWGRTGPIRTYEIIFYATKGQRGLREPILDIIHCLRVGRADRVHAAQKPIRLLEALIEASTIPGDVILDPCCGSGSTLVAAKSLNRPATGIEIDEQTCDQALVRIEALEEEDDVDTRTA